MRSFREWLAKDLFVRGKGRICDHFFQVLDKEKVSLDADDATIFSTYVTNRFPEFIVSPAGLAVVADLVCVRDKQEAVQRVAKGGSPVGPALPPKLAERLKGEGYELSACEDPSSGLWDVEVRPLEPEPVVVPGVTLDCAGAVSEYSDAPEAHDIVPFAAVRWAGVPRVYQLDWGDPGEGFLGGAVDAALAGHLHDPRTLKGRGKTVVKVPDKHVQLVAEPEVKPPGVSGARALLAEVDWGLWPLEREATLAEICQFIVQRDLVSYSEIELVAKFKATTKGPYPSRWYVQRKVGTGLRPRDLLGQWRGKDAPIDRGPPPVH